MSLEQDLVQYLKKLNPTQSAKIESSTPLISGGLLDSLGIIEVISFLEDKHGLSFGDNDLVQENFESVNSILALVEKKKRS
jgi:acyl carrier protein